MYKLIDGATEYNYTVYGWQFILSVALLEHTTQQLKWLVCTSPSQSALWRLLHLIVLISYK